MAVKHSKTSAVADSGDTSLVQPSDWNSDHVIDDGSFTIAKTSGLQAALDAKLATSAVSAFGLTLIDDANQAAAQSTLGLVIGTNVQAYDAGLLSIAGLTTAADRGIYTTALDSYSVYTLTAGGRALGGVAGTADTFPYFSASNTVSLAALTAGGRALINATGTANTFSYFSAANTVSQASLTAGGRALINATGTANRIPYFSATDTVSLATTTTGGLALLNNAGTADTFPYYSASNTVSLGSVTAAGRALLDDADAATQRNTLELGTAAVANLGTSGDTVPKNNTANTYSAAQTFNTDVNFGVAAGGTYDIFFRRAAANSMNLRFYTGTSLRWLMQVNSNAESGSNAGSNFGLIRYDDAGAAIATALSINRATGAAVFDGALSASNLSGTNTGDQTTVTGNAGTATALQNARTIAISGPITGTATSFNGTANITIPVTDLNLAHANVTGTLPVARLVSTWGATANVGPILTLGSITAGSGYTDGVYPNVAATGGTGAGARLNVTVAGGVVTVADLHDGGATYTAADSLTVSNTLIGGTGSGFSIPVATVRTAALHIRQSTPPRLRLDNSNGTVTAGSELGSILFGANDSSAGGRGDNVQLVAVGEGTSGGGALQIWTSANAGQPTLAVAFHGNNTMRLYNSAATFYSAITAPVTANRTLTLADGNTVLVAGTMVPTTGTGATGSWGISVTGSAATLTTGRTIAISGPITGTATSFNGSANITIPVTALDVGHANVTGTLAVNRGGTGIASYTTGNYINASGATTLQQRTPAQVLSDIGALSTAVAASTYLDRTGGTMTGEILVSLNTAALSGTSYANGHIELRTGDGSFPILGFHIPSVSGAAIYYEGLVSSVPSFGIRTSGNLDYKFLHTGNFVGGTDYITPAGAAAALADYLPLAGGTLTGGLTGTTGAFTGTLSSDSTITSGQNFVGGTNVVLSPLAAGIIYLRPNGAGSSTGQMRILSSGNVEIAGEVTTAGSDYIFTGSTYTIRTNTSDGADTGLLDLTGGGDISNSRGAYLRLFGNEHATGLGIARLSSGTNANIELLAAGAGKVLVTGGATTAKVWIQSSGNGTTAVSQSDSGIELTAAAMNTTSKYTPGIKFGSQDPEFTTTNPKFGAMIVGYATQTYSSDATGGMGIEFFVTPNAPGTGGALTSAMTLDQDGNMTMVGDFLLHKASAIIGIGITATRNGGLANYAAAGTGDIGVFSEHAAGRVRLRPNGRLSSTGEVIVETTQFTYDGNVIYHAGNFVAGTNYTGIITLTAGNGLTGGGTTAANRTFTLGTPTTLTASTTNAVTSTSHTHAITGFASLNAVNTFAAASIRIDNSTTNTDLYLDSSGVLAGGVTSNISGGVSYTIFHTTNGTVYLRPNGRGTTTNQASLTTAGLFTTVDITATGTVTTGQNFVAAGGAVVLATTGASTVNLRPNGAGSATGQLTVAASGDVTAAGTVTAAQNFISSSTNVMLTNNGAAGTMYFRPNGAGSTTGQATISSAGVLITSGAVTAGGTVTSSQNFVAAGTTSILATTGAGTIYLRPNGAGSSTGEFVLSSTGGISTSGAFTAGGLVSDSVGNVRDVPQNLQNANYTVVLLDRGKHILSNNTTNYAWTIPPNSTTAFPLGSVITFVHSAASGTKTVTQGAGVSFIWIDGTTGNVALTATKRSCTALKIATDTWLIS